MRFTLQTLMLSVLVVASALGAFGAWGLVVAGILLAIVAYIRNPDSAGQAAGRFLLVLACSSPILLYGLAQHGVQTGRQGRDCPYHLKQLVPQITIDGPPRDRFA